MKIVHVVYSMAMGGAEMMVAQLCRIQRANGHDVSVCAYSELGTLGESLRAEGFTVYVPGEAHPARTMLRYAKYFRKLKPDVVHCHNPAPTLQAAMSARLAGVRRVLSTRHSLVAPPYDLNAEFKYNMVSYCCDWIVGICEITCENLRNIPRAHRKKIMRVYNGVTPIAIAATLEKNSERFQLLFVGRLAEVKDLGTLIRAVAEARARVPQLELRIVGDGPVRASLEALANELGARDCIRFEGQQMDTARYFATADVFTMSSVSEGLPMSLLQAMSLGLPALTTDVGGMAEVLRATGCGLLAPVGDYAAMAGAIIRLAQDKALMQQLGARAKEGYMAHFTLQQMDASYMALYR